MKSVTLDEFSRIGEMESFTLTNTQNKLEFEEESETDSIANLKPMVQSLIKELEKMKRIEMTRLKKKFLNSLDQTENGSFFKSLIFLFGKREAEDFFAKFQKEQRVSLSLET